MAQAGILAEDDRVELLNGEIVEMPPIGSRHAACVDRLNQQLSRSAGELAIVRVQSPIRLSAHSEPEPDLALLTPREDFYTEGHPGPEDTLLVIEVAETSAEFDRQVKLPLYAQAGIPEVWLIDLAEGHVEVHRTPSTSGSDEVQTLSSNETLSPQALPELTISVDKIL